MLGLLQPKNQMVENSLVKPRLSGMNSFFVAGGIALLFWDFPQSPSLAGNGHPATSKSRSGAVSIGVPDRVADRGLPSREMTVSPPSFSATIQLFLAILLQFA